MSVRQRKTVSETEFHQVLAELRPRLHRYCARMVGSAVDGEDVLQETLLKAFQAWSPEMPQDNVEGWLFRIAHNASLDFLRSPKRREVLELPMDLASPPLPETQAISVGFRTFLQLPELQRCAVILKDVLGYSAEEVAAVAGCTTAAAKSALQRGRANLRRLVAEPEDTRLPIMLDQERRLLSRYVALFQAGDFDAIRDMLAKGVKLDLVNRLTLEGRDKVGVYFTRYNEVGQWDFALGAVEGRPAVLAFDLEEMSRPTHFILIGWQGEEVAVIRDFLFTPYVAETLEWTRLKPQPHKTS